MAEGQAAEAQEPKKKSMVSTLIMLGIAILLPACVALVIYLMVLRPMLTPAGTEGEAGAHEKTEEASETLEEFPEKSKVLTFDDLKANVLTEEGAPQALVLFSVVMVVNEEAGKLFEEGKDKLGLFEADIVEKMRGRTRSELENAQVLDAILKQIRQKANQLLKQLEPKKEMEVYQVKFKGLMVVES